MTRFRLSFLLCFLALGLQYAAGQSLPYQTLLKGLYDSSFPVIRPEQITDLKSYQVLDAREPRNPLFPANRAAGLAVAGLATYVYLRIRGARRRPAVATRFPPRPGTTGEIIEIEATEVPPGKPGP